MTTRPDFERNVAAWLTATAGEGTPEYLDEIEARVAVVRQRAWWSSPERWLPMDLTTRLSAPTRPQIGRALVIAMLIVALLVAAVLVVGSRRQVAPPFGTARNGSYITSRDGDVYLLDKPGGESRLLALGDGYDFSPIFSRDGTKVAFLRSDGRPSSTPGVSVALTMYVANADGSKARPITSASQDIGWFDWSPDGSRIAYVAGGDLWVADAERGDAVRVPGASPAHFPTWLPPAGDRILYWSQTASPAIVEVAADGSQRRVVSKGKANNEFDYSTLAVSPDGSTASFTRWRVANPWVPRVYALDIATGKETVFPTETLAGQRGPLAYSPDGRLVAYARIYAQGAFELVIANADRSGNERVIGQRLPGPPDGSTVDAWWAFTPDGTGLLVRYGSDDAGNSQLLPLDGSPPVSLGGTGGFVFGDVQRLAP